MTHNTPDTAAQNIASAGWTQQRTKLVGIGSLVGGLGGLAITRLPIGSTGLGITPGAVSILYPVWYVLFAVALLAANARYDTSSRYVAVFFGLSLVSYAGSTIVLVLG